jgi:amidase/6-aminohexanoate-cyclic-dimer hydrolase
MMDATAGPETGEAYSAPAFQGSFLEASGREPGPLRIAVSREKWGAGDFTPEVRVGLDRCVEQLQRLGHEVEEDRPDFDGEEVAAHLFRIVSANTALAARQRATELGCSVDELEMEEGTRFTVEMGNSISGADYVQAVQINQRMGRMMGAFHQKYDIVLAPTLASTPVAVGHIGDAPPGAYAERLYAFMGDTGLYNQTGQPSISLPLHWSDDGLPVGMMFTAAYGSDALLLQLAGQLESAMPWADKRAPLWAGV